MAFLRNSVFSVISCSILCTLLGAALTFHSTAATFSDSAVDAYNLRVGTQTFAGLYQFTTNTLLVETAQAIRDMGSDVIKLYLGANYPSQYRYNLAPNVTNLLTLARDDASCHHTLDLPFRHIIAWAYPFSNPDAPFGDGNYTAAEQANDYREMFDLTCYLLTNYNNSGKTFYLGHWEGDGYLSVNNWQTNPAPAVVQGMIGWENTRQKAVDDAKAATAYTNVSVFYYAEANRVRDAMLNGPTNNVRVINAVAPYVTNLDYLSYSSYDAMNLATSELYATLDYMEAHLPTNKVSTIPGERIWIGEYGWGGSQTTAQQEPTTRAYIQRLLNYGNKALPYILFWEIYNNEANQLFCLIDSNNVKAPSYYLHQRFVNNARLLTAQFKETNGRLPTDGEFVSLVSPMLNQPLAAPVALSLSTQVARIAGGSSFRVSATLAQGVYGDDQASVWVFWGRQDGGTTTSGWEQGQQIGLNTNFNPAVFALTLTNLAPNTNYFFRFYATNSSGEAWAPASAQFSTTVLNPADYGARMKIVFAGYNRGETLLDFPVLVNLGTNLTGFSYRQFASPTGGDLRFADAGGLTALPFEIDEWNTNGASLVWVRVPQLSSTNDFIWAYWGDPLAPGPPASSTNGTVWSSDHFLVYHLKESGFPYADSTLQHPALTGVAPASTAGVIGRGCFFDGTSKYLNAGAINLGDAFTLSAWIKLELTATNIQTVWANKSGGYNTPGFALFVNTFQTSDQTLALETGNGTVGANASTATGAVSPGQWHQVAAAVDRAAGVAHLYVDGTDQTQASGIRTDLANQAIVNLGRFTNGNFSLKGTLDEARLEAATRSSNWVWASWMTVASNTALAGYSSVTQQPPTLSISAGNNGQTLSWPAYAVAATLYTATNLAPPIAWQIPANQPALVNTQWQVTLPPDPATTRFYRLQLKP
ncbi:MAG TPA: DUF2341 domain-containing protein [Candidatus Acidoferrum sp.]|nr:DUF2341 domain-containing protein [Candidatus Acidoferrum sp.]